MHCINIPNSNTHAKTQTQIINSYQCPEDTCRIIMATLLMTESKVNERQVECSNISSGHLRGYSKSAVSVHSKHMHLDPASDRSHYVHH